MDFATFDLAGFEASKGAARAELATQLDGICKASGFLVLTGHGISHPVIHAVWHAAQSFFAQDAATKLAVKAPYAGYPYGYLGPDSEALAKSKGVETPPDLKESFNGGPLATPAGASADALAFCYQPTIWPALDGFRAAWEAYYAAMEDLAARIMRAFAAALSLPDDYFDAYIATPISALRALHYPATPKDVKHQQQRAGAHTDYGSLTILLPQAGSQGLQVQHGDAWIDVPAPQDAFVINIGDLMARWTADKWVSTLHRVVAIQGQPARQSLAFFHQPDWDAQISPLDGSDAYSAVKSGPYLMEKFKATGA